MSKRRESLSTPPGLERGLLDSMRKWDRPPENPCDCEGVWVGTRSVLLLLCRLRIAQVPEQARVLGKKDRALLAEEFVVGIQAPDKAVELRVRTVCFAINRCCLGISLAAAALTFLIG